MNAFRAFRIHSDQGRIRSGFERIGLDALTPGDVVIRSVYSAVNYKDALAATGKAPIVKRFPLVGGIDVAGFVESSAVPRFNPGDAVLVCGCGLSETRDGGYAEYVRVPAECVVKLPEGLSMFQAMGIGTAGFTAALAVLRLEANGQAPAKGPILVTGASGGVGSIAVDILSAVGYEVVALSAKAQQQGYLKALGAARVVMPRDLAMGTMPLEKALWGGAVDTLGGDTLAWLTRTVKPFGCIASIGLAAGSELHTTVMPFILRGISLLGVNSTHCPASLRDHTWDRLGADLKPCHLDQIVTRVIDFNDLPGVFEEFFDRRVVGRIVVRLSEQE